MYPYELFWGIDLYGIFMTVGFVAALLVFDTLARKGDFPDIIRVFYMFTGIFSIGVGLFGASLVQSVFNYIKTGVFKWQGLTFYGGVIVGAAVFILITFFAGGLFFKEKEHLKYFGKVCEIAPCSITAAHAFGRIGCLFAGCCYGLETDSFRGLYMHVAKGGRMTEGYFLPVQLYEAVFLALLCAVLIVLYFKKIKMNFVVYLSAYGVWRFFIEFLRADERGAFLPFLSPSQAISLMAVLLAAGIAIFKAIKKGGSKTKKS